MIEVLDCAGRELRPDDLVVYVFGKSTPGGVAAPFAIAWVVDIRSNNGVIVNTVAFMDLGNQPQRVSWWHAGCRRMNPQCLRRMPPGFFHSLPFQIRQVLTHACEDSVPC